jgi:dipeptidase E
LADAQWWAADIGVPAYAIDEQTAVKVVGGSVEVVSEGQWTRFEA